MCPNYRQLPSPVLTCGEWVGNTGTCNWLFLFLSGLWEFLFQKGQMTGNHDSSLMIHKPPKVWAELRLNWIHNLWSSDYSFVLHIEAGPVCLCVCTWNQEGAVYTDSLSSSPCMLQGSACCRGLHTAGVCMLPPFPSACMALTSRILSASPHERFLPLVVCQTGC